MATTTASTTQGTWIYDPKDPTGPGKWVSDEELKTGVKK